MSEQNGRKTKRTVACRECQRLKLKCTRSWPCDSCVKRGVADICPEGALPTTKGHRYNLLDTSRLYERNVQMGLRIRQLEAALAAMQSNVSHETHPLLQDDLLSLGAPLDPPPEIEGIKPTMRTTAPSLEETLKIFGTLSISVNGRTTFHSPAVSADFLVEPEWTPSLRDRRIAEILTLPPEIINLSTLFPFGETQAPLEDMKKLVVSFLPSAERISFLAQNYFDHISWWSDCLPREQFDQEIYPVISMPVQSISADRLSVLFIILAMGAIFDIENTLDITTADSYWQLSRAAFCLEPLLDVSTTCTIQALQLMITYLFMTNRQKVEHQWVIMGLIARLIHSSGLHFDAEHWIKDQHIVERRRKVFYEVLAYDSLMSFTMGRPPGFSLTHIQCKLPVDSEKFVNEHGIEECGFPTWRYRFTKECLLPMMDDAFGAKPPTYDTIIRLDRKLREYPVPSHLVYWSLAGHAEGQHPDHAPMRKWMQRLYLFCLKETSLLYIHRSHLAHCLLDHPESLLEGKYAASVLASFRSAVRIIAVVSDISSRYSEAVSRTWWIWQCLFQAGIVVAMVVLRSPKSQLAQSALNEINKANDLLQTRTVPCRSAFARRLMRTLRDHAEEVFLRGTPVAATCGLGIGDMDELVLLTATSRTVSRTNHQVESISRQLWHCAHPELLQFLDNAGLTSHQSDSGSQLFAAQFLNAFQSSVQKPSATR